jgi:DNA-binding Lrp family transcriptional regulator
MEQALVLISIAPTAERKILEALKELLGVQEAHFLYGPYDIYIKIEAKSSQELQELVLGKIRLIPGIRSTMTCFIAD